ncbi:MAG: hypothetical protein L6R38_000243 [Xanthoria sp. 2 TBL-2021]|nr:MAG: hypothetical protein L6R38_000243 [Xanthoria sp. 2 TBL-2021]
MQGSRNAPKRALTPDPSPSPTSYTSSAITHRVSLFLAIDSPTLTAQQLQSNPSLSSATHRVTAFRVQSTQHSLTPSSQNLYTTTHDDYDGEKYSGIILGPVRFEHIKNCAKEAVSRYLNSAQQQSSQSKKARTVDKDEDEKRRNDLIRFLPSATRVSLYYEDKAASPAKVPEYSKLPLKTLENLERARDATIGWLLAQIEKAEVAQQRAPEPG